MKSDIRENVLILTYWSYNDALIQAYTLPYVRMIRNRISEDGKIYLMTLDRREGMPEITKPDIRAKLKKEGIEWISYSYSPFGFKAMLNSMLIVIRLWWLIGQKNINTIHSWCSPAGGLGWILSKLTNKKLILDSYEPHAEPMVEAGQWDQDILAFRLLIWLEKKQSIRAETVIACVDRMRDYAKTKYNATFENFFVKPAGVDFDLFHPIKRKNPELVERYSLENKKVFVYAGKFGGSYLTDEVFALLKEAKDFYKNQFMAVLLNNHSKEFIKEKANDSGLGIDYVIHEFVPHSEVPAYMGLGDVGIVPFIPVPSKRYGSPIKTSEYLSMGMPVIITENISDDSDLIEENGLGVVMKKFDPASYFDVISRIDKLLEDSAINEKARTIAMETKSFKLAEKVYNQVYS